MVVERRSRIISSLPDLLLVRSSTSNHTTHTKKIVFCWRSFLFLFFYSSYVSVNAWCFPSDKKKTWSKITGRNRKMKTGTVTPTNTLYPHACTITHDEDCLWKNTEGHRKLKPARKGLATFRCRGRRKWKEGRPFHFFFELQIQKHDTETALDLFGRRERGEGSQKWLLWRRKSEAYLASRGPRRVSFFQKTFSLWVWKEFFWQLLADWQSYRGSFLNTSLSSRFNFNLSVRSVLLNIVLELANDNKFNKIL